MRNDKMLYMGTEKKRYTVSFTPVEAEIIQKMVDEGRFNDKADLIRHAVRSLIENEERKKIDDETIKKIREALGITV